MKIFLSILLSLLIFSCNTKKGEYVCTPCDLPCDELAFSEAGTCPHCQMALLKKSDLVKEQELTINKVDIQEGSGVFLIEGGFGKKDKSIKVYYHKPENFKPDSRILLVIPGAGRNGDSYRDAWIPESEKYGLLILSPMYAEEDYAFEDYHLCGLMYDLNLNDVVTRVEGTNIAELDESEFTFNVQTERDYWIFNDLDRIFDLSVAVLNSDQKEYDVFGHSAGGQILHRFAIFQQYSKADRILASNSGFYTMPDFNSELPFGLKNTPLNPQGLEQAFSKNLVLFIGELDNETETGGTMLHSTTANKQGLHRAARARYFYEQSKAKAGKMELQFNWKLEMVPDVGHNHRKMGDAAAKFLYEGLSD